MAGRGRLSVEDLDADPRDDSLGPHQQDARDAARTQRTAWREGSTLGRMSVITVPRAAWLRIAAMRSTGHVKLLATTWVPLQPLGRRLRVAAARRMFVTTRSFVNAEARSNRFAPPCGFVVRLSSCFCTIVQVPHAEAILACLFSEHFASPCCRSALAGDSNLPKDLVAHGYPKAVLDRPRANLQCCWQEAAAVTRQQTRSCSNSGATVVSGRILQDDS